jgi:hypothetical protein
MRGGVTLLVGAAALAAAGCAAKTAKIEVRSLNDRAAKLGAGSDLLEVARGHLALGNVGLAIEGYHAALREQPDSIEAMGGLAACYDAMGRTDLSRQYYEAALAVAPRNPAVLNAFAASLEAQGNRADAQELRSEAALAIAKPVSKVVMAAAATTVAPVEPAAMPAPAPQAPVVAAAGASVTVALPPARPAAEPTPMALVRATLQPEGPRLQRLSLGEVALLTAGEPAWQAKVIAHTAQATTVRWTPLEDGSGRPNIRVLNAARTQGLAARTRDYLMDRGWRRIEIGDADAVREDSLIMTPEARQTTARSLAAQFGFRPRIKQQGQVIVVLLGRDAAGKGAQARG